MPAVPEPKVHVTRYEQVLMIAIRGELDHDDAEEVDAAFHLVDQAALPMTAVDLSQLSFADSAFLNALLDTRRRHEIGGRDLILLGPLQPAVRRLLTVSGTLEYFAIATTGPTPAS
ncbi:STAS domain-containing protein [Streptomyces sp. NPDC004561]